MFLPLSGGEDVGVEGAEGRGGQGHRVEALSTWEGRRRLPGSHGALCGPAPRLHNDAIAGGHSLKEGSERSVASE